MKYLNALKVTNNEELNKHMETKKKLLDIIDIYQLDVLSYLALKREKEARQAFDVYEFQLEKFLRPFYNDILELSDVFYIQEQLCLDRADFKRFIKDRLRIDRTVTEEIPLAQIRKAYNRWRLGNARVLFKNLQTFCDELLPTKSEGKYYGIRVFLNEEDVEDYDKDKGIKA